MRPAAVADLELVEVAVESLADLRNVQPVVVADANQVAAAHVQQGGEQVLDGDLIVRAADARPGRRLAPACRGCSVAAAEASYPHLPSLFLRKSTIIRRGTEDNRFVLAWLRLQPRGPGHSSQKALPAQRRLGHLVAAQRHLHVEGQRIAAVETDELAQGGGFVAGGQEADVVLVADGADSRGTSRYGRTALAEEKVLSEGAFGHATAIAVGSVDGQPAADALLNVERHVAEEVAQQAAQAGGGTWPLGHEPDVAEHADEGDAEVVGQTGGRFQAEEAAHDLGDLVAGVGGEGDVVAVFLPHAVEEG